MITGTFWFSEAVTQFDNKAGWIHYYEAVHEDNPVTGLFCNSLCLCLPLVD
jgi:hypothetical protein